MTATFIDSNRLLLVFKSKTWERFFQGLEGRAERAIKLMKLFKINGIHILFDDLSIY